MYIPRVTTEQTANKPPSKTLGVWLVLIAGMLAIPVGLLGYLWLERANLTRMGYSVRVEFHDVQLSRQCIERSLLTRAGRRYVRSFEEALMVEVPMLQYHQRPERVRVVVRMTSPSSALVESAYYKNRPLSPQYDALIGGGISELVDSIGAGCSQGVAGWRWSASCTRGPGFTGVCPSPTQGTTLPADARLQTFRD